jgi:hypothetical protein
MVLTFLQWETGEVTRSEFWGQFTNPLLYNWIEKRINPNWIREDPDIYLADTVSLLLDQVGTEEIVLAFTEMIDPEKWKEAAEGTPLTVYYCLQIFIEACYRLLLLQDVSVMVLNGSSEKRIERIIRDYCLDSGYFSLLDQNRLQGELEKIIDRKKGVR